MTRKYFQLITLPSQNGTFKPCIECMECLLIQVSVPSSLCYVVFYRCGFLNFGLGVCRKIIVSTMSLKGP